MLKTKSFKEIMYTFWNLIRKDLEKKSTNRVSTLSKTVIIKSRVLAITVHLNKNFLVGTA